MKRLLGAVLVLGLIGLGVFWFITRPKTLSEGEIAGFVPDLARGEYVFNASGCASCHSAEGATGDDLLVLSGGKAFPSPFGTFRAPNISPGPQGIGGWSALDLANALHEGVSPDGSHYFPALPYGTYRRMAFADISSLHTYLMTLPPSDVESLPHEVGFPFNIRRSLGGWKFLFLTDGWVVEDVPPEAETGRYIAEAMAHCGECHTPRNILGGPKLGQWLGGAPNPSGKGTIPNITPGELEWSEDEITEYLTTGFTPDFDVAGGLMAEVVQNLAKLPKEDVRSIAKYLKAVPAITETAP
jgi:mono/diheme cytochrome c family protein